jgi:hypothetical protein
VPPTEGLEQRQLHYEEVREIIRAEEMWERVPDYARHFSPENLISLVKFAYFGGFIDMAAVRRLLLLDRQEMRRQLVKWYEEIREQGCWLC